MKTLTYDDFEKISVQDSVEFKQQWTYEEEGCRIVIKPYEKGYLIMQFSETGFNFPDRQYFTDTDLDKDIYSPEYLENIAKAGKLALEVANNYYRDYQLKQNNHDEKSILT